MKWNSDLKTLNYRLAELYPVAPMASGLINRAGLNINLINLTGSPVDLWYNILDFTAKANDWNRVIALLETVTDPHELGYDDDILKSLLENFRNGQFSVPSPKLISIPPPTPVSVPSLVPTTPNQEQALERIVSQPSTFLPISFLDQGSVAARAVVRVVLPRGLASGFIIADNLLVTCNHVIPNQKVVKEAKIQFNYQKMPDGSDAPVEEAMLDPDTFFVTSIPFDFTIVKIQGDLNAKYGFLPLAETRITLGNFVNIIQHPTGGPKQIALYNNEVMAVSDSFVHYLTETLPGSAGAPVFNSAWEVVAVHHAGGIQIDPEKKVFVKEGIRI